RRPYRKLCLTDFRSLGCKLSGPTELRGHSTTRRRGSSHSTFWIYLSAVSPQKKKTVPFGMKLGGLRTADSAYKLPLLGKSRSFATEGNAMFCTGAFEGPFSPETRQNANKN